MSYSSDLRSRVLDFIERGGKKTEAAALFGVHCQTVYGWVRKAKQGQLCAATPGPKAASKVLETALRQAIDAQPDAMLKELAREFDVHPTTIFYACKKWNITRKKNVGLQASVPYEKKGVSALT
jgi:transposase